MKAPEEIADKALVLMADIFPTGIVLSLELEWRCEAAEVSQVSLQLQTHSRR